MIKKCPQQNAADTPKQKNLGQKNETRMIVYFSVPDFSALAERPKLVIP
jgi:hypothetical protein